MNLLIDNALSPSLSHLLQERGHDALHVREIGMQAAVDPEVFAVAMRDDRVLVSADTDFGALLAVRQEAKPSFILFRKSQGVRPKVIADQIDTICREYERELQLGCVLTITEERIRIRSLPIE